MIYPLNLFLIQIKLLKDKVVQNFIKELKKGLKLVFNFILKLLEVIQSVTQIEILNTLFVFIFYFS